MSNIYIQEPPTSGKVLLKTSVGDIDIELWTRECPKACRNFIQLCMEGYYNGTTFHRLVKGFIVQGGDPNGDGTGGESIYGHPFKDEFHSRLRYSRRGLVGMANSGKDDNASQFFFTFAPTPELENKNTLFGKVTGDTVYNMLKLEEGIVDHQERPMYSHRIISAEVLSNPFNDIVPRALTKADTKPKKSKKQKEGVKNFGLLSFGEEAEGDEEETTIFVKKNAGKAKSLHDVADDPKLSKEAIKVPKLERAISEEQLSDDCNEPTPKLTTNPTDIKNKLASATSKKIEKPIKHKVVKSDPEEDDEKDILLTQEQEQNQKNLKEKSKIREEIASLKRQYQTDKMTKDKFLEKEAEKNSKSTDIKGASDNQYIHDFIQSKELYTTKSKSTLKGQNREDFTLSILSKFKSKLGNFKNKSSSETTKEEPSNLDEAELEKEIASDDWLAHNLNFNNDVPVLAKDASTKGDDWYDAYDPRNPLNKRKRGADKSHKSSSSKSSKRNN